jgi:hypothetical protein
MPDAYGTEIYDIDGSNIVGSYTDTNSRFHGFLYDGTSWTTLDMPGATDTYILGIDGDVIVGSYKDYINSVERTHGFVYTIPEPTTLLLFGPGAAIR